ncbi:hypothetical protein E8E11_011069 [Didymella keratinophila]|nr:hypothetical protein E8E11_011069 [Didymella keratinophila]
MNRFKSGVKRVKAAVDNGRPSVKAVIDDVQDEQPGMSTTEVLPDSEASLRDRGEELQSEGMALQANRAIRTTAGGLPQQPPRPQVGVKTDCGHTLLMSGATDVVQQEHRVRVQDDLQQIDRIVPRSNTVVVEQIHRNATTDVARNDQQQPAYNVAVVFGHNEKLRETLADKEAQIRMLRSQNQDLLSERQQILSQVADLEKMLCKERERSAELRRSWKRTTAALGRAQVQDANYKVDDRALQGHFKGLLSKTERWVDTYFVIDIKRCSDAGPLQLRSVTINPDAYLRHQRTRQLLFKSLLMKMLVDHVFNNRPWWAGNCAKGYGSLSANLLPAEPYEIPTLLRDGTLVMTSVNDFSRWKAKTAIMLSDRVDEADVELNIDRLLDLWKQSFEPFVAQSSADAWIDLKDIIRDGIEMDLEMHKSRALFTIHTWSAERVRTLDHTQVETPVGFPPAHRGMTAELIMEPLITKTGNGDGDAFDNMSVLSKWVVVSAEDRESIRRTNLSRSDVGL